MRNFDIWQKRGFATKLEQQDTAKVSNFLDAVQHDEAQLPIAVGSVDYNFNNPQRVAESFRHTFGYLSRVELDVARNVEEIDVVFGGHLPPVDKRFVNDIWDLQERHHGYVLDHAMSILNLPPPQTNTNIGASLKAAGVLGNYVPGLKDTLFYSYMTTGVTTEAAASRIYRMWSELLKAFGEEAFAITAIDRINKQEPKHLAYYTMRGNQVLSTLSPWQLRLARAVKERSLPLTGVTEGWHKAQLGRLMIELTGGDEQLSKEYLEFVSQVERVYQKMMYYKENGGNVPGIVTRSLAECREIALEQIIAETSATS